MRHELKKKIAANDNKNNNNYKQIYEDYIRLDEGVRVRLNTLKELPAVRRTQPITKKAKIS